MSLPIKGKHPSEQGSRRPPDPARKAAVYTLERVLEQGAYANLVLAGALDDDAENSASDSLTASDKQAASQSSAPSGRAPGLNAQQRSFTTAMVYGTLTRLYTIDHVLTERLKQSLASLEPTVRTILRLGVFQLLYSRSVPPSAAVDESVRLCQKLSRPQTCGLVNAVLRSITREPPLINPKNAPLYYSLPPELYGYVKLAAGAAAAPLLAEKLLAAPPVTLRTNCLKAKPQEIIELLAAVGIEASPGSYLPEAVVPELGGQPVHKLVIYQDGLASVQDEGAMLTSHAVDPQPGESILDLCAAPGGKSAHMAELTCDKAAITACDIHPGRVDLIRSQAERLGITSISAYTADATGRDWPQELAREYDRVLADVPCSGLGLLARKPEIRRNMTHERIQSLLPLQAAILDHAATLVRPGGVLVYSTCTFNPAENDGQVDSFLARQAGAFSREDLTRFLPAALLADEANAEQARGGSITLLPHRHGTDGFYIARLRKDAAQTEAQTGASANNSTLAKQVLKDDK